MAEQPIVVSSKKTAIVLGVLIAALLAAHIAVSTLRIVTGHDSLGGLVPLFDFWQEGNVPTLFSTLLLGSASLLLYCVHVVEKRNKTRFYRRWALLSLVFLFLATDEFTELHEKLSKPLQQATGALPGSLEYWGWVVPYAVLAVLVGLYFLPFYLHLAKRFKMLFALSAILFVGGALGFEVLEGLYGSYYHLATLEDALTRAPFAAMVAVEEVMEFSGVALFICSLLEYLRSIGTQHTFELTP